MFPDINDYNYSCQQINHIMYRVTVITPDKVKMFIDIQSQGFPPPNEFIYSLIQNPVQRKQFVIELETILPPPEVKVEEVKIEEIKEIPAEPEIKVDLPPEPDKVKEDENIIHN